MNKKTIQNKSTWELEQIKKALTGNLAALLNTEEDERRLKLAKEELKNRGTKKVS